MHDILFELLGPFWLEISALKGGKDYIQMPFLGLNKICNIIIWWWAEYLQLTWVHWPGLDTPGQTECCCRTRSPSPCEWRRRCRHSSERPPVGSAWERLVWRGWGSWCVSLSGPATPRTCRSSPACRALAWTGSQERDRGSQEAGGRGGQCRTWWCWCSAAAAWPSLSAGPRPPDILFWSVWGCPSGK